MMRKTMLGIALFVTTIAWGCAGGPASGVHEVQVAVTENGFEPKEIQVKTGDDVTLVVTRKTDATCAKEIVVGDGKVRAALPLNQSVRIDLGKVDAGGVKFACGENMIFGAVVTR
jgi:plastocyanin domain-containing protein